jgi:cytochrome c biogenesis protein CcmG/thiol:disulfide interchange protein DsbE
MRTMRARALVLAVAALVAVGGVLLLTGGSGSPKQQSSGKPAANPAFDAAPPPIRALHDQRSELLDGGTHAFERRIAELRGYPVVVNQWASWCGPCRAEFPVFQRAAVQEAKRIAFVGVDARDYEGDARTFLADEPLPYPSFKDPDIKIARSFNGGIGWPTTAFYDKRGKLVYTHPGPYRSVAKLLRDARRYGGA